MKKFKVLLIGVLLAGAFSATMAMDGICIANIVGDETYCGQFNAGKLVKYTIVDNYVTKVDTLPDIGNCPVLNKSGTYFAYIADKGNNNRAIVFRPVDGAPSVKKEIPIAEGAVWLWWVNDGSLFFASSLNCNIQLS